MKTSELAGPALDWAVAKCDPNSDPLIRLHQNNQGATVYFHEGLRNAGVPYRPSTDWAQGGPIIELEVIKLFPNVGGTWSSQIRHTENHPLVSHKVLSGWSKGSGDSPLIAAMRCYVSSRLGDEVEIPEELRNV